ncbi:competence protein CoiA [Cytobacillus sp. FJAT-54145]|uniref:Competence protein CoiA n=1 Tax=Cytobacillus spartinae TaxID=3299023 RepID=A0ABW6K9G4_9BACI
MLTAKTDNGQTISLGDIIVNKQSLLPLRGRLFYCPQCSNKVILKAGPKKVAHFAHEKGADCTDYYERETEYHLLGKLRLFEWLKNKGLSPELEPYFSHIRQRADISFVYNKKTYCIEFQCSPIPEELFIKRTTNYLKNSLIPIWILGGKNIKRSNNHRATLSSFDYLFLRKNANQNWFIPAFCPNSNQLIILNNLYPFSIRHATSAFSITPITKMNLEDLLNPPIITRCNYVDWLSAIQRYKTSLITNSRAFSNPFLLELYHRSLSPQLLPPYIGFPLKNHIAIETPPFIWQTYLIIDNLVSLEVGEVINFQHVYLSLLKRINKNEVRVRRLPLIKENTLPFLLKDYLILLSKWNIIRQLDNNHFILVSAITSSKNVLDAIKIEEEFYRNQ